MTAMIACSNLTEGCIAVFYEKHFAAIYLLGCNACSRDALFQQRWKLLRSSEYKNIQEYPTKVFTLSENKMS